MNRIPMTSVNTPFRGATLSPCGKYRYNLWRRWNPKLPDAVFVMLNPSTADAMKDDPTVRRCVGLAKSWRKYGGVLIVNLYAYRATDPKELLTVDDPVGPENEKYLLDAINRHGPCYDGILVAAWGTKDPSLAALWFRIACLDSHASVHALRVTKDGHPQHPLYVPNGTKPVRYLGRLDIR